jgi:hypothetical protein
MLEAGGRPDFAQEAPLGAKRLGQFGVEHLQGHKPVVLKIAGEIHRSHAAAPELAL